MGIGKRITIGLFIDWPEAGTYQQELLAGAHQAACRLDVNLLVISVACLEPTPQDDLPMSVGYGYPESGRLDGIILATGTLAYKGGINRLSEMIAPWRHLPLVSIGNSIEDIPSILTQNRGSYESLLDHLFGHHHYRNPVFISGPSHARDALERLLCFTHKIAEYGIEQDEERIYYGQFMVTDGELAARLLWDDRKLRPDVAICANDNMAYGLIQALLKRGIRVPEDVAVTGFDDQPFSEWCETPLTTIHQPLFETGVQALELVYRLIGNPEPLQGTAVDITLTTHPVFRSSCGCSTARGDNFLLKHHYEVLSTMIRRDIGRTLDFTLADFGKDYLTRGNLTGKPGLETDIVSLLGIGSWYISLWDSSGMDLDTVSRLHLAWENGQRLALPPDGVPFRERDILPDNFGCNFRWTSILQSLIEGSTPFGTLILEYQPGVREQYEIVRSRISGTLGGIRTALRLKVLNDALQEASLKLEALTLTDEMTGHYNRRGFLTLGKRQISYCRRQKEGFWIFFIDLDGLKTINDTWGHDEGDQAIRSFAKVLHQVFRETDLMARLGGDEFIILVPNVSTDTAALFSLRIESILTTTNAQLSRPWKLACSIGCAFSPPDDQRSLEKLMQQADKNLYEEKRRKKNQITA